MKRIAWYQSAAIAYPNVSLRIISAILSAHLIIIWREEFTNKGVLFTGPYFQLLTISTLTNYLLIAIVYWMTKWLDHCWPWERSFYRRLCYQSICGMLLPIVPACVLVICYFIYRENSSNDTSYFIGYLQQVILMLAIFNAITLLSGKNSEQVEGIANTMRKYFFEFIPQRNFSKIAYISLVNQNYFAFSFTNERVSCRNVHVKSIQYAASAEFFLINKTFLVNRAAISGITMVTPGTIKIKLVPVLCLEITLDRRETIRFKKWFVKGRAVDDELK